MRDSDSRPNINPEVEPSRTADRRSCSDSRGSDLNSITELSKSISRFSWSMSLFGFQQMFKLMQPGNAANAFDSVARATEEQFDQWTRSLYRAGDSIQSQILDSTARLFGAGGASQPSAAAWPGSSSPLTSTRARLRGYQNDRREEVIVSATRGTGQFSQDKKYIALRMTIYKLTGERDGYHEGVWEANFKDPKELLGRPAKPEGPMNEPRGPVEHIPVAAYTKAQWVFGDRSSIIVVGPASSHLIPLEDGSFIFMVSTAQIITGGTGRYNGAYGLVQSLGATHVPANVNLFGPDPVSFEATTFDTFRVIRGENIGRPEPQPPPGPQPGPVGSAPSSDFPFKPRYTMVRGSRMHYIEEGEGDPILFLHGNPTWSYLWRNVLPHLKPYGRCIAPDLIGMGRSDKPAIKYTFLNQAKYLEGFIKSLGLQNITLVIHDWGTALGFHYAMEHQDNIKGIAFFEALMKPYKTWEEFPAPLRDTFRQFRTPGVGRELLIEQNVFVEQLLPQSVMRRLSEKEMDAYREPFRRPEDRKPIYTFANQLPIEGIPGDVTQSVSSYSRKLQTSNLPKLLIFAEPGAITSLADVEWAREHLQNLKTVNIGPGIHFHQEDNPVGIGQAIAQWYAQL